ncbi:MAG: alkene reductase [Spirosomataceae bacterium]
MPDLQLLSPYQLGDLTLRNRIIMSPMTRSRSPQGFVTDLTIDYYAQRASAGLIITEATNISSQAVGAAFTPGLFTPQQIDAWRKVTDAVHEQNGLIFCQLWHSGRISHPDFHGGNDPVAPSAISAGGRIFTPEGWKEMPVPRELTIAEIQQIINDYRQAARNAQLAGFDGVELHGAFGYLPNQFLSDQSNRRTDEYGGSVENRVRFTIEVMQALLDVWDSRRVGIRIAPNNVFNAVLDSNPAALYDYLVERLNPMNLAYLSLMNHPVDLSVHPQGIVHLKQRYRESYQGTLMTTVGYTRESGEETLQNNHADLIAYGTLYIANPDLVERFEANLPLNPPDRSTFYGGGAKGYIDYPAWQEVHS